MKVVHLNSYLGGGAATAARRLHDSLITEGVDSTFCYASGPAPAAGYAPCFRGPAGLVRQAWELGRRAVRIKPYLWGRARDYDVFSDSAWLLPLFARQLPGTPDIVHLHWTADLLNYGSFFSSLDAATPLVWTLHDMHPFTGGCHYSFGCDKFTAACGECMQLNGLRSARDPSWRNLQIKRRALDGRELHVVADSHWLEGEARRSAVFAGARSFRTIHYGLDTEAYAPRDKAQCRRTLGIPLDAFVVCFGSASLADPRKGLRELLAALRQLGDVPRLTALMFGAGTLRDPTGLPEVRSVGYLRSSREQAPVYSAADVFVIPSLAEAFGQTALEAMACGTPVVGFDTGGIPDMVRPHRTGLLAPVGDPAALAAAIRWMALHPAERSAMGREARAMAVCEFTLQRQASRYRELYATLLSR